MGNDVWIMQKTSVHKNTDFQSYSIIDEGNQEEIILEVLD